LIEDTVREIVAKVKRLLNAPGAEKIGPVQFAVPCVCGHVVEGQRQPTFQLVACPKCGEKVFVFPKSSWPPVVPAGQGSAGVATSRLSAWQWRVSLGAGLGIVLLGVLVVWLVLGNRAAVKDSSASPPGLVGDREKDARVEMSQGKFHTALEHLEAARQSQDYATLSAARKRELEQLRLQAALLASLGEVRLSDIVRYANDLPQNEWERVFAHRYRGKSVLLDGRVRLDAGAKLRLDFRLFVGNAEARVEISDLDLLRKLTIERPVRLIFGARLAGIGRDRAGAMVVHLDPQSGVLMTDRSALEAAAPILRDDPDLAEVLKRQLEMWARLP
jgi:hypothetical protein